jgi:hypothetical protein
MDPNISTDAKDKLLFIETARKLAEHAQRPEKVTSQNTEKTIIDPQLEKESKKSKFPSYTYKDIPRIQGRDMPRKLYAENNSPIASTKKEQLLLAARQLEQVQRLEKFIFQNTERYNYIENDRHEPRQQELLAEEIDNSPIIDKLEISDNKK